MIARLQKLYRTFQISRFHAKAAETAANITATAHAVADAIEERKARQPADGKPLFVMLGEAHDQPAHHLMEMLLALLLRRRGHRLAIGLERPYNKTEQVLKNLRDPVMGVPDGVLKEAQSGLSGAAMDDPIHTRIVDAMCQSNYAEVAAKLRNMILMQRDLRLSFNDAANDVESITGRVQLDLDDPITRAILQDNPGVFDVDALSRIFSRDAMHLRNRVIQSLALTHAAARRPDIYLQICGGFHVVGNRSFPAPYAESLTGLFEKAGHAVLGVTVFNGILSPYYLPDFVPESLVFKTHLSSSCFAADTAMETEWLQAVLPHLKF